MAAKAKNLNKSEFGVVSNSDACGRQHNILTLSIFFLDSSTTTTRR